jgi:hypothetical protein
MIKSLSLSLFEINAPTTPPSYPSRPSYTGSATTLLLIFRQTRSFPKPFLRNRKQFKLSRSASWIDDIHTNNVVACGLEQSTDTGSRTADGAPLLR